MLGDDLLQGRWEGCPALHAHLHCALDLPKLPSPGACLPDPLGTPCAAALRLPNLACTLALLNLHAVSPHSLAHVALTGGYMLVPRAIATPCAARCP